MNRRDGGFTMVELLVVIAIIAIVSALFLPTLSAAKKKAQRTTCVNNLKQIAIGVRMYCDDANEASPSPGSAAGRTNITLLYSGFKALMKSYVGLNGESSPRDKVFACPADQFYPNFPFIRNPGPWRNIEKPLHEESHLDFSSYAFNGGDNATYTHKDFTYTRLGLTGVKLSSVKHPARTVLVVEGSAPCPWSWHEPHSESLRFNDAKNVVSYVDGHVSYLKIYWNGGQSYSFMYDPPPAYEYQWSPN